MFMSLSKPHSRRSMNSHANLACSAGVSKGRTLVILGDAFFSFQDCLNGRPIVVQIFEYSLGVAVTQVVLLLRDLPPRIVQHVVAEHADIIMRPLTSRLCYYAVSNSGLDSLL